MRLVVLLPDDCSNTEKINGITFECIRRCEFRVVNGFSPFLTTLVKLSEPLLQEGILIVCILRFFQFLLVPFFLCCKASEFLTQPLFRIFVQLKFFQAGTQQSFSTNSSFVRLPSKTSATIRYKSQPVSIKMGCFSRKATTCGVKSSKSFL